MKVELVRCTECGWVGPKDLTIFGHDDLCCPRCGKQAVQELHPATMVSYLVDVTDKGCLTCTSTECEPLNPCIYKPSGVQIAEITQIVAIKDGKVKAWLEGKR